MALRTGTFMTLHFITIIAGLHRGGELRQYLLVLLAVKELRLLGVWWPAICRRDAATPLQELLGTVVPVHNALNEVETICSFLAQCLLQSGLGLPLRGGLVGVNVRRPARRRARSEARSEKDNERGEGDLPV